MKTTPLSCSHAIIKYLISQKIIIDGEKKPLFPGAFAIYGHGNVACIGQAMEEYKVDLPGYRGHHEQYMALTGIGYSRAMRRKQIFVATSSVGPGSTNMVTAAAVALSNRLPILFLPGDTFASRFQIQFCNKLKIFFNQEKQSMMLLSLLADFLIALQDQNKLFNLCRKQLMSC
jgi:3D-(3,5/4)-trihydroxycyclohexane-1,2-dione acylhydrolase (decyclizing)